MLSFLNKKSVGKGILVLKTNGFGLKATVVNGNRDALNVTVSVKSQQVDPVAALTDVMNQLKNVLGKNVPNNVLLLHISAIPDLITVTENFETGDAHNLLEMLRWEMEGVVALQSPSWDLGWLLMGRGYITAAQRDELVDLVAEEKQQSSRNGGRSPMRLGELAIRERIVSKEQIAECLQIQQKLQVADQRLLTQWRPQPSPETSDYDIDSSAEQHEQRYLCSAMPVAQQQQWLDAVKKVGGSNGFPTLNLRQIYPFAGATVPLLDQKDEASFSNTVMLTEFHQAYVFCAVLSDGKLDDVSMVKCSSHGLKASTLADILSVAPYNEIDRWIVADLDHAYADQIAELEAMLQLESQPLTSVTSLGSPEALSELGVVQHFLGCSPVSISPLSGMPPPDPFYKSKAFKMAIAASVLPLFIAGYEGFYRWQIEQLEAELVAQERSLERLKEQRSERRKEFKEAQENISRYETKRTELSSLNAEKQLVEKIIVQRQAFIQRLLPILSESINDGVVLESMKESSWYEFSITGKAVDQASIDNFNQVLSISLEPLDMYIAKSPSSFNGDSAVLQNGIYIFEFLLKQREGS